MKLEWRPATEIDRDNIAEYIAKDNPRSAIALDLEFAKKAELARANPAMYRVGRISGTREIVVQNNYVMVYKVDNKAKIITILRILHAAQQFPKKLVL
ncbi:type II toxin-antitoxin system RelE/ParE family toxin [Commensalibacter nepenthis]|uniref:Type II toxin-antitoxin system RelE/ParE family toxin n=1 Tax=Commensalibacter nepenthis TaxID=3043872 RepID=A0ABT6Q4Q4_9PROT|nr:type II toxin-antitoxin system RelE/ParE family toxin [Commensalibacter sp. TBRC 10068]MDI2111779.1 type II toxin-antitoxin system RelE/ParE family toxin [Commensalibacter sp. TBRC 10068]